jgi:hypothetical protein
MEIYDSYTISIENIQHFVYEGICDGILTKWITKLTWDGKINIQIINKKLKYIDSHGNEILIFDENDIEYKYIKKC